LHIMLKGNVGEVLHLTSILHTTKLIIVELVLVGPPLTLTTSPMLCILMLPPPPSAERERAHPPVTSQSATGW